MEKLEISLPSKLCERLDEVVEFLDFGCREEFVQAAVRFLLDRHLLLAREYLKSG